ncbi:hypothetical protein EAH77_17765 [Ewingella americana]|uniref:Uncharacterized protein n=1 Tax=Ewingella americana TaxID=41202 RepID=A0A502G9C2_9GAMM|nr:hypothetical protein EAH77_17765 [Ewingella americana]
MVKFWGAERAPDAFKFKFKFKVVGVGPHRPEGRSRSALWTPSFLKNSSCAGHNGRVSGISVIAANSAAARYSHFGFGPARKNTLAVFHHSFDVVLNAAEAFLNSKPDRFIVFYSVFYLLTYIAAKAQSKMAPDERFET